LIFRKGEEKMAETLNLHSYAENDPTDPSRHFLHVAGYVFADATARAACTTMLETDLAYQKDTKKWYSYDGAAWNLLGPA
jgi:hypothetical protein